MKHDDLIARVDRYYSDKLREHGASHRGVDWGTQESQELRFAQLLRACPLDRRFSLNDFGCGYGALVDTIGDLGAEVDYCGYDISEAMVAEAGRRHPDRDFTSSPSELVQRDCTVASGIFNVTTGADEDSWTAYIADTIREMARLSRTGIAWNMLTSYSDPDRMREDLHYADPMFWFDFAKRELSRWVAVLHDYGLYEFTVVVRLESD